MPLIAAAGYALLTAVAMPRIFDDQVLVYPQKQEAGAETVLLHFGAGNLTQSAYLVIAVLFCVCAAIFIAGRLTAMRRIFDAFLIAGLLSAGIAFWQLAAKLTGLPFPDDFLHSNTGWAQLSGQSLGFLPRINGSYSEPAALASYMCAYVYCAGWLLAQGCRHRLLLPVFAACLLALVISTSTTGYVVAAFGVVLLLLCVLRGRHPQVTARLLRAGLPVLAGVLVLAAVLPAAAPQVITAAAAVMTSTLDKGQSASYDDRTQADQDSLAMAAQTYGLGVGFGSNRPSSLVPSLLSNVGVPGPGAVRRRRHQPVAARPARLATWRKPVPAHDPAGTECRLPGPFPDQPGRRADAVRPVLLPADRHDDRHDGRHRAQPPPGRAGRAAGLGGSACRRPSRRRPAWHGPGRHWTQRVNAVADIGRARARAPAVPVFVNGRFLSQPVTGVQRYSIEMLRGLDAIWPVTWPRPVLLAPRAAGSADGFCRMPVRRVGRLDGHAWEQIDLPRAARGGLLVSLGNTGPVLHRRQLVLMHDAGVFSTPYSYSWRFRWWYKAVFTLLARRQVGILSTTGFARDDIAYHLDVPVSAIGLLGAGVDHALRHPADREILPRHGLARGRFVLAVGSLVPHKNLAALRRSAERLRDHGMQLVVTGAFDARVFAGSDLPPAACYVGRVSDGELRALYEAAACFVFPSRYEGFGFPALEAMLCGCPVVAAAAGALPDICGSAAVFVDPANPDEIASAILALCASPVRQKTLREAGRLQASRHRWQAAAQALFAHIDVAARPRAGAGS